MKTNAVHTLRFLSTYNFNRIKDHLKGNVEARRTNDQIRKTSSRTTHEEGSYRQGGEPATRRYQDTECISIPEIS